MGLGNLLFGPVGGNDPVDSGPAAKGKGMARHDNGGGRHAGRNGRSDQSPSSGRHHRNVDSGPGASGSGGGGLLGLLFGPTK